MDKEQKTKEAGGKNKKVFTPTSNPQIDYDSDSKAISCEEWEKNTKG